MHDVLRQAYGIDAPEEQWVRSDLKPGDQFPSLDPTLDVRPPTAPSLNDAFDQLLDQVMTHVYPAHPRFEDEVRIGDLRTALKHVERAVGQKDQRAEIPQSDRKAVRKVLAPLDIAVTGEAHIVLKREWRDHFHKMQHQNPGVPVTVERLKRWMDEPKPRGLDDRVANLVIAAYALMDNRVLVQAGETVEADLQRLDPTVEVRTQALPPEEEWDAARPHAEAVFGAPSSPIRNASNVSKLIDAVKEVAGTHAEAVRDLVPRLEGAVGRLSVDGEADRLRTARAARELLEGVLSADDIDAVSVLATLEPPTSAAALGRSIKSAHQVAGAIQRTNWDPFVSVAELPGEAGERGKVILGTVREALCHDELSQALADVLDREERKAVGLLTEVATKKPTPGREPPDPGGDDEAEELSAEGEKSGLSGEDARGILSALLKRVGDLEELRVKWRLKS